MNPFHELVSDSPDRALQPPRSGRWAWAADARQARARGLRHGALQVGFALCLLCALAGSGAAAQTASSWQVADWRSWLHGEPAPQPKAAAPAQLALVSRAAAVPADAQVEDFLRALAAAVMARDGRLMLPRLSERYTVDDLPSGSKAPDFLVQAVDRMPGPVEMVVQAITPQGEQRVVLVEFRYSNDRKSAKTLRLDTAGRLLSSDLFRLARPGHAGCMG